MKVTTTNAKSVIKAGTVLTYTNGTITEVLTVTEVQDNKFFTDNDVMFFFDSLDNCWSTEEAEPVASSVILQSISKEGESFTGICGATFGDNVYYCRFAIIGNEITIEESMSKLPKHAQLLMYKVVKDNKERFTNEV